jgi:hypothetical protein
MKVILKALENIAYNKKWFLPVVRRCCNGSIFGRFATAI